jgi:hypothetical protein
MATLTLLRNLDVIYNVDHSVGKYGRNHNKADVQLVQYLVNLVIAKPSFLGHAPFPVPQPLVTNGICTQATNDAILWVQKAANSVLKVGLAEDATINHAENLSYSSPHTAHYTIWFLNFHTRNNHLLPLRAADIPLQPLRSELEKGLMKSGNRVSYIER